VRPKSSSMTFQTFSMVLDMVLIVVEFLVGWGSVFRLCCEC
jgi:hypothetical protein